ncbi:MAG: 30S ribosomal protein S12 methylthiotransferase RimO [bacterium]|nr:30S ribosomal protein S12 methylthiotransferase RimO [bacterium]MDT8395190.1 30S ribosomal protein S12 methylthiotransferase RimO [bacterium]
MKIAVTSLGCNKNLVDTEVMLARLQKAGCVIVDEPELADCLLINTCSFLTEAVEESLDRIVELASLKGPEGPRRLVVTGCMVARYGEDLLKEVPEIDALVLPAELDNVVAAVSGGQQSEAQSAKSERIQVVNTQFSTLNAPLSTPNSQLSFPPRVLSFPPHRAYLKIGEGCSNRCSYCLIPSIRGDFSSRSVPSLTAEMEHLVGSGVREITLVAQDSGRYGIDLAGTGGGPGLPGLVNSLLGVPGDYWLRVLYVHPARVTGELLEAMISDPRICPYLDIPFQHVAPQVLARMGRGDAPAPMEVVKRVRAAVPGVFIRTTLMTGFPGETREDFERLREFVREAGIDHLGVFSYSCEEGTAASRMGAQVPGEVAKERAETLMEEQSEVSAGLLRGLVGREMTVMAEGFDEEGSFGRHQGQAPEVDGVVRVDEGVEAGSFVQVKIVDSGIHDLKGEVLDT